MPTLPDYHEFEGRHWETGSIRNALAYQGVKAPHTGQPLTEAMLMGISGGAVMGYFSFAYKGYDPHVAILTRNTFHPMDTIFERLAIPQQVYQTGKDQKAVANLIRALGEDSAPLVWADYYLLPYNDQTHDAGMWGAFPLVVYGYEPETDTVRIADRARVPLTITTDELAAARRRIKQDKNRLMTLDAPDMDRLASAVQKGIFDCLKLYTEAPPKGSRSNFGLPAFQTWAQALTSPKPKNSWDSIFPAGRPLFCGLTSAYERLFTFGHDSRAERDTYADFLDEAAVLLNRPALKDAASLFRRSAQAWEAVGMALLPEDVAPFRDARELTMQRHRLFIDKGGAALADIKQINRRLNALKQAMETDFPLDAAQVRALKEHIAAQVMIVHDIEQAAVTALQAAMA
jgi:hypothetical protein